MLGEPSFGKGWSKVFPLSQRTGLALTTAFYYTPSGRSIQKPLRAGQLGEVTGSGARPEYKTQAGRTVRGGGGIEPDHAVYQERPTRFIYVLEATASFPNFATEYLQRVKALPDNFDVTPALLDEFQQYLSARNIRPSVTEWSSKRDYITDRLKQEILNQGRGVVAGDEIEVRRDPVVRRAWQQVSQ